jgi:hypothetical protein
MKGNPIESRGFTSAMYFVSGIVFHQAFDISRSSHQALLLAFYYHEVERI